MDGLKLACLYSYGCSKAISLGINEELEKFFIKDKGCINEIKDDIKKLDSFFGYQNISKVFKKDVFNKEVVRTYWFGDNPDLKQFSHNFLTWKKLNILVNNLTKYITDEVINRMINCFISYGLILEVGSDKAVILTEKLVYKEGRITLEKDIECLVDISFINSLEQGYLVSVHFEIAREVISLKQVNVLKQSMVI